jgi:hypothetical protein
MYEIVYFQQFNLLNIFFSMDFFRDSRRRTYQCYVCRLLAIEVSKLFSLFWLSEKLRRRLIHENVGSFVDSGITLSTYHKCTYMCTYNGFNVRRLVRICESCWRSWWRGHILLCNKFAIYNVKHIIWKEVEKYFKHCCT